MMCDKNRRVQQVTACSLIIKEAMSSMKWDAQSKSSEYYSLKSYLDHIHSLSESTAYRYAEEAAALSTRTSDSSESS